MKVFEKEFFNAYRGLRRLLESYSNVKSEGPHSFYAYLNSTARWTPQVVRRYAFDTKLGKALYEGI